MTYKILWQSIRHDVNYTTRLRRRYYTFYYFGSALLTIIIIILALRAGISLNEYSFGAIVLICPIVLLIITRFWVESSLDRIFFRKFDKNHNLKEEHIQNVLNKMNGPMKTRANANLLVDNPENHYRMNLTSDRIYLTTYRDTNLDRLEPVIKEIENISKLQCKGGETGEI